MKASYKTKKIHCLHLAAIGIGIVGQPTTQN